MKVFYTRLVSMVVCALIFSKAYSQPDLYDLNTIQKIEIKFSQENWDYMLDTAKAGTDGYTLCDWVKINGYQYDSAGVKYKGSSSYDPSYAKNPFNISLDKFKSQTYNGIKTLKLANCYADPSMIREVLGYNILKNYMDCPRSNFAQIYINGAYIGLYSNDESINKIFCSTYFNSSTNTFIKCSPDVTGPQSRSSLQFLSADSSAYFGKYELESDYGWNDLVELSNVVSNQPSDLGSVFDLDRLAWMLAFNDLIVNLDSYNGWFSQNYYIYKDNFGRYNPIVWDLNMSFGGFPFVGTQGGGSGSLTVSNMKSLTPTIHAADTDWPLIKTLLGDPYYRKIYFAHLRTMLNEQINSGLYLSLATQLQALADTAVQADTNKFFSYPDFVNGLTTDVNLSTYTVPGIKSLMDARGAYLASFSEITAQAPVFGNLSLSNTNPLLNEELTIQASVTNATEVYFHYRFGSFGPFIKTALLDDGLHNDGAAGDQVYGATFVMSGLSVSYYFSALNQDAAMLSPERAEHEFYSLDAHIPSALPGEVLINELLAKNENDTVNEAGSHEDWVELKNNTDHDIDLFGLYLTDNYEMPTKFAFSEGTIIPASGILAIWADEEASTQQFVHCSFKLSTAGEELMLSDGLGNVIDSVTFGAQSPDISYGRCPNGTGNFVFQTATSFNAPNLCGEGVENKDVEKLHVFPNPSQGSVQLANLPTESSSVELINGLGASSFLQNIENNTVTLHLEAYPKGLYSIVVRTKNHIIVGVTKLLLTK